MKKLLLIPSLFIALISLSQNSDNRFWTVSSDANVQPKGKRQIIPQKYMTFKMNGSSVKDAIFAAPNERTVKINESSCIISLPLPNGKIQKFRVVESSIMEPALAAQFPNMKTFSVKGIDDPYANGKLDWNEFGFHGMVRTVNGDFFIDPYCLDNVSDYITYYTNDFVKDPSHVIPEAGLITEADKSTGSISPKNEQEAQAKANSIVPAACVGSQLRSYRLAIACTGQYAQAATGSMNPTNSQILSKVVTSVNRVNGVYETEVSVRLILVSSTTLTLYGRTTTNTTTPYPAAPTATIQPFAGNSNANVLINESQNVINALIGSSNYDIGHTFSTGGGGLAFLGCVCSNSNKARGITGSGSPVGDPYDIDYVAHEIGHQFSGNHTFNASSGAGSCSGNRNGPTSMEPGSGVTIMGYAGICGAQDLANNSIAYFHAVSYDEIVNFTQNGNGNNCPVTTTTGNQPPVVSVGGNYNIPKSTPFFLTGSGSDPDGDVLTYSWEETDAGATSGNWNSGNKPYFRSYAPVASPTRYFPNQGVVASGNYTSTKGEYLSSTPQTLSFRLTARDNKAGGGGVCYGITSIVVAPEGPFVVSYPSDPGITWYQNGQETITWNVNGTNVSPVSCDTVRILISYNNGNSYTVFNNSTPNDGAELITVPTVTATESFCMIKIEGKGNVFYDISNNTFEIADVVGLKKISQNNPVGLNVWPNPFNDRLNFKADHLDAGSVTTVKVNDVLGKTLLSLNYQNKSELNESIDLSQLSKGIYFVSLSNNNRSAVYRIVKD